MTLARPYKQQTNELPKWLTVVLFILVWTLVGLAFSALSYASAVSENRRISVSYALAMNLTRFYLWAILSLLVFRCTEEFPVRLRPFAIRNFALNIAGVFLFASIHQAMFILAGWKFDPTFRVRFASLSDFYRAAFLSGLYLNIVIALLIVIAQHARLFYRDYRAGEMQRSLLQGQLAQAELQALKMQLHPHFLFNALHSISALVLEDPLRANLMVSRLGDFLRLTLERSEATVPLREELEFLRCYLEIEQVRFQDRLSVDFDVEEATLNATVPHLILQPLVENAISHVVARRSSPTRITVRARRLDGGLKLEVADNGPGINNGTNFVSGLGINNVRARLQQTYGSDARFEMVNDSDRGLTVSLKLPFQT